jgi:hypothetical protein
VNTTTTTSTVFNFTYKFTTTDTTTGKAELYLNGVLNQTLANTTKNSNNTFLNINVSVGTWLWNVKQCGSDNTTCAWASNGNFTFTILPESQEDRNLLENYDVIVEAQLLQIPIELEEI